MISETLLWRAVIKQAWRDALKPRNLESNRQQIDWFNNTRDFCLVCDLADLDPQIVQKAFVNKLRKVAK